MQELEQKTQEAPQPSSSAPEMPKQNKTPGRPKRTGPKKKRTWPKVLLVIVLVIAALYWFWLRPLGQSSLQAMASVYTPAQVTVRDLTVTVKGSATVQAIDSYRVTALVRGEILEDPFEEGDIIEEGALLYRIDAFDAENAISQAELSLRQANLNYNDLLDNQSRSLKNLDVTSTADGVVTKVFIKEGDAVAAGTAIATVLDRDNMLLTVPFHSVNVSTFTVGQTASISVSGTMETIAGVIDEIAPVDSVGAGGTVVRNVTFKVSNPGTLSPASTATATVGEFTCAATGSFRNAAEETIYAKASGEVEKLYIAEGDSVYDGQIIGQMPAISFDSQREQAQITIKTTQITLENARHALENYTITSPIRGTVVEKNMKAGDNIDATTSGYLAVIYDMSTLTFDMRIDELDIGKVEVGQTVEITADALPGETYFGKVEKININGQTANGVTVYPVTVHIDEAGDLLPGMNVSAEILCEKAYGVLTIPVDAVKSGNTVLLPLDGALAEDGSSVIDVTKINGERTPIELGRNDRDYVEVTGGLEEGDWVLIENNYTSMFQMMGMSMG